MQKIGNVSFYTEDEQIIEVLDTFPSFEECDNLKVLEYIQERAKKKDFGAVLFVEDYVYSVYKFDKDLIKAEDAGLIMTSSKVNYSIVQLQFWEKFKNSGMSFSEKIFEIIKTGLTGGVTIQMFNKT